MTHAHVPTSGFQHFAACAALVVTASCASLSGLSSGGTDGGSDQQLHGPSDGASDVTARDASKTRDAGSEAARDGDLDHGVPRSDVRAPDASHDATPEATTSDALPDGCMPFEIPDAGSAPACAHLDGNACNPDVPGFQPVWRPPVPRQSTCTVPQVIEFIDACYGPGATTAACSAFESASINGACLSCLVTDDLTATGLGPIIDEPAADVISTNQAGCLALLDPCQIGCARAINAARECAEEACSNCTAASSGWYACQTEAQKCSCKPYNDQVTACTNALQATSKDTECFRGTKFAQVAQAYGIFFCAGGPLFVDAGLDGG